MAVSAFAGFSNYNYLEEDIGNYTSISVFKYARNRPNSKPLRTPVGFITLPLPEQLAADHYAMQIGEENMGFAGGLTEKVKGEDLLQIRDTLRERLGTTGGKEVFNGLSASDITNLAVAGLANAPGIGDLSKFITPGVVNTTKATAGYTANPHTTLLFNNVQLRQFTFNWKLSPRSASQSQKLNNIINMIKRLMHPNIAAGGFALDYPNLVTMNFNNDKEGIVKVDYAFIQDFSINATPQGHVYYKGGYPAIIEMSMTLKETRIKTAEDFPGLTAAGDTFNRNQYNDASTK